MKNHKTIGVIGGIGAEASANLYLKMIHYCQEKYKAQADDDYPSLLIYSSAINGFDESGLTDADSALRDIVSIAQKLENAGAELLIIACNSIHVLADQIQSQITIPLFNIVGETIKQVQHAPIEKVGLLCSHSSRELHLYESQLTEQGIEYVQTNPVQQKQVDQVIESVIKGQQGKHEIILLKNIIRSMQQQGAQAIILGCTELPLAINQIHTDTQLFNSLDIIIESAVDFSFS